MSPALPQPGEVVETQYRIESVLGSGGFGQVYLATQLDLERSVAIKLIKELPANDHDDRTALKRFYREAKLIGQLRDPHTVSLYNFGETAAGLPYMVTEYIDGETLDALLRRERTLSAERVVQIIRQVLSSLEEAHAMGILHRDIKPANIQLFEHLRKQDQVKVLDFGIAKPTGIGNGLTQADLTQTGYLVGTPRYMAPECFNDQDIGPAADLYSLGLVAYEALVGRKAIAGDTTMTVIAHQVSSEAVELPDTVDVPRRLRQIVNTMASKALDQRYTDAETILDDLDGWDDPPPAQRVPHKGLTETDVQQFDAAQPSGSAADSATMLVSPASSSSRPPLVYMAIGLALTAIGVLTAIALNSSESDTPTQPNAASQTRPSETRSTGPSDPHHEASSAVEPSVDPRPVNVRDVDTRGVLATSQRRAANQVAGAISRAKTRARRVGAAVRRPPPSGPRRTKRAPASERADSAQMVAGRRQARAGDADSDNRPAPDEPPSDTTPAKKTAEPPPPTPAAAEKPSPDHLDSAQPTPISDTRADPAKHEPNADEAASAKPASAHRLIAPAPKPSTDAPNRQGARQQPADDEAEATDTPATPPSDDRDDPSKDDHEPSKVPMSF